MKTDRHLLVSRREILTTAARAAVGVGITGALGWPALALAQGTEGTDKAFTNSIGIAFVPIPAGTFLMGSPDSDRQAQAFEKPQHRVTISRPFQIGKHEVTQAQWQAVLGESPYARDRSNPYYQLPGMAERITRPDHPATVSWNDAQAFIAALNRLEGGTRYRLPTEAEWEYAARGPDGLAYPWGDEFSPDLAVWEENAGGATAEVGSKPNGASWVGALDMSGNVWEWA